MFETLLESRPSPLGLPWRGVVGAIGLHVVAISALFRAPLPAPVVPPIMIIDGFPTDPPSTPPVHGGGSEGAEPFRVELDVLNLPPLPVIEPLPGGPDVSAPAPIGPGNQLGVPVDPWGTGNGSPLPDSLVQERPVLLAAPQPVYPARLREAGVEGVVLVQVVVDTLGRAEPGSVRVLQHSEAGFDASAVAAIRAARFRPARVWGRPVRVLVQVPVAFRIRT
jgi:protein TonB